MSAGRGRALGPPPPLLVLVLVLVLVLPPGAGLEVSNVCAACHIHATCHQIEGKSACICNYGFVGNGRTHCQDKDECQIGASKICGNHTLCHNTYGSFYCVCLDGFRASNNNKTFIPNDGTNCTDIDECEEPGLCGYNARCVNTEGSYECYCNDGYKLENGERSFQPNVSSALCKEIRCGSPPEMKHGYIVGNYSLVPGSTVHYECKEGFYSNEGKSSYCTADRAWEPATLSCKGVDCGVPPSILNARQASLSGTTYGSEVTYSCIRGYFIASGNQTAVCNAKGQWDGADLVCKEIDCGKPLLIPHTEIFWDNSTTLLSRVFYKCKEGYYFNGERNFSECKLDQTWESITYICKEEELFSNLTVFNETCVKWQMRTGRLGVQKTYTFHILGRRWDEKTFSEDVILNITMSEDNPKVCLDLNSGSNYVVNITTISSTNIPVSVTVAVQTKVKEAFNNVLIFNNTCLKWRRNVRGADMEDRYLFHVQGQRWYQKEFLHEMTFNITTRKQAPEVCFDLQPGTNYSINISMVALNFSLLVSMTTQITGYTCGLQTLECASPRTSYECVHQKVDLQAGRKWSELKERISSQTEYSVLESSALDLVDPPFPDIEFVAAKGSAPLLRLRKAEDRNGPISLYQVIVLPLGLQSTFVCDSFATATFFSNTTDAKGYVAAEFRAKDVADNMSVALGDRHYYGKFYNAPLKLGKEYCVFLRIISEWNKVRTQSCAIWAQIKNSSPTLWYMTAVVLGSVAAVCLILFLSFLAARSYLYRTVHSPPAALACEGVRLSATMDTARASSLLETENVSLL